jgi:hypothetical protein
MNIDTCSSEKVSELEINFSAFMSLSSVSQISGMKFSIWRASFERDNLFMHR